MHISDPAALEAKRQQFIVDGPVNLHIVADFDGTLSRSKIEGQKVHSTLAIIREGGYLNSEYVTQAFALADKYRPIEYDLALSDEEKAHAMQQWWEGHLQLKIAHGMHKGIINEIIQKDQVVAKHGLHALLTTTHEYHIPVLIFSAGAGSIIEEFLRSKHLLHENVHIISNFYSYDSHGNVTGYRSKIIHSMNKNEVAIKGTPYAEEIKERKNVLLLGDSLGDATMAQGMSHDAIIRIGFLNGERERLAAFAQVFDIVIFEDDDLSEVQALLKEICA